MWGKATTRSLYIYLLITIISVSSVLSITAITIFSLNPKNDFLGWKNLSKICDGSGNKYITCIKEELYYSKNHVFSKANVSFTVQSLYFDFYKGLVQFLEFGTIGYDRMSTVDISLNSNLSYEVFIMDPKAQIFSSTPSIIPRRTLKLSNGSSTITEVYFKVEVLEYVFILHAITILQFPGHKA